MLMAAAAWVKSVGSFTGGDTGPAIAHTSHTRRPHLLTFNATQLALIETLL